MTYILRRFLALLPLALFVAACTEGPSSPEISGDESASAEAALSCVPGAANDVLFGLIQSLQAEVDALTAEGVLNDGQAKALGRHLTNAQRQLERGQYCAFNDQITAFRNQFEALVGESDISDRDAFEARHQARLALGGPTNPVGQEEHAPGVPGEVKTLTINGSEMVVRVIDGLAIWGGDMILGFEDELTEGTIIQTGPDGPLLTGPCSGDGLICGRWSDQVIGYDYFFSWGADSGRMIDLIERAINHWEANTGMRFERRSTGERVVFRNGNGCSSWVGRNLFAIFDPQYIFLNNTNCANVGVIAHEIGHAVGLFHEQSRNDRDEWITVNFDAIQDDREINFLKYLANGNDLAAYDYGSLMHYGCMVFHDGVSPKPALEPIRGGVSCDDIGQREALSPKDVLGAYWLYRPEWRIVGAEPYETRDRFELSIEWETEPMADEFINWRAFGRDLANGQTFSTLDHNFPEGEVIIFVRIEVEGVTLSTGSIVVNIQNDAPVVDLGPDRNVDLYRTFIAAPEVSDTEDGTCPASVCSYQWDPAPTSVSGATASYYFDTTGPQTITVTVTDGFGESTSDELVVTVVDSPPVPVIQTPATGLTFATGSTTAFSGSATDANFGPGPGAGELTCLQLDWSSSDPTDVLTGTPGCAGTITFGDAGTRTLTLEATDATGNTASRSITLEVDGCDGGCAPNISFVLDTPPDLVGSEFDPPFTGPGYYLDTRIEMTASIADGDGPGTPITLDWRVERPCFSASCSEISIGSGSVFAPNNAFLSWIPSANVEAWTNCTSNPFPYVIRLYATDGNGNTSVYSRTIHLACRFG